MQRISYVWHHNLIYPIYYSIYISEWCLPAAMLMDVEAMPSTPTKMMSSVRTVICDREAHAPIIDTHIPNCILHYGSHI